MTRSLIIAGLFTLCSLLATTARANPIAAGEFIWACQSDQGYHVKIEYTCGDSTDYPTDCGLKAIKRDGKQLTGKWLGTLTDPSADLGSGVTGTRVKGYWCDCHVKPGKHTYSVGSDFGDADVTVTEPGTSGASGSFCYDGPVCVKECANVPKPVDVEGLVETVVDNQTPDPTDPDSTDPGSTGDKEVDMGGCSIASIRSLSPLALTALLGLAGLLLVRRRRR